MTSAWTTLHINQSMNGIPKNCIILGMNATIPWDNPRNLISRETGLLVDRLKSAIFIPILYLVGAPANVINMAVFFRQGLSKRINMCLFSLALLDLISLTVIFSFYAERIFTIDGEKYWPAYGYMVNNNVIGLIGFGNGSVLLSAIISTERCICVLFPLRSQRCIPTKVLAAIIVVSVLVLVSLRFVVTAQYQVTCFYEMRTDIKSWQFYVSDYYFRNKAMLKVLGGMHQSLTLLLCFSLWAGHGSYSSGFSYQYHRQHSDWLKLLGWLAAWNILFTHTAHSCCWSS